jgi:two-component system sensor histidine kinase UhpB
MPSLWAALGLRTRLTLGLSLLLGLSLAMAAALVVQQARRAVHTEVNSAMQVGEEILRGQLAEADLSQLPHTLHQLTRTFAASRHICWQWRPVGASLREDTCQTRSDQVPIWFQRGLHTGLGEYRTGFAGFELRLLPQVGPELEEAWREVRGLLLILTGFGLVTVWLVSALIQRSLRPIAQLSHQLRNLDAGMPVAHDAARYPNELQPIAEGINGLQQRLRKARADHHSLLQRCLDHHRADREQWARDLHDQAGQWIAAIEVETAALQHHACDPQWVQGLERIRSHTRQLHQQTRSLSRQLHRPCLGAPLRVALAQLCQQWQESGTGWMLEQDIHGDCDTLPADVAVQLYGIAQEALSNAAKHAQAQHVCLRLAPETAHWHLIIQDDGVGLQPSPQDQGLGISGIQQRARCIDAELAWSRSAQGGTTLSVVVPI